MIRVGLIAVILVAPLGRLVYADGFVTFRNDVAFQTPADRLVRDISGLPLVGTNYLAQLYYGVQDAEPSSLDPVAYPPARFRDPTHARPGTWAGGDRILWGFFEVETVTLQVRVWDGTVAGSYEEAALLNFLGTQHGVSEPFTFFIPVVGPPVEFWFIENFRGFTLVPEPSLALLAMIGIVSLYFSRRRRE
jgi:hypothetical protein